MTHSSFHPLRRTLIRSLMAMPVAMTMHGAQARGNAETSLAAIEQECGGRLGVSVKSGAGRHLQYRNDERFPLCSTFKLLLAAAVLSRVDQRQDHLQRRITYTERDMLSYAPITRQHLAQGQMSVADLCQAAICYSDNTAANLLLNVIGGPSALNEYLQQLGDRSTRLDRMEPALNSAEPGDPRDTTTPDAIVADMERLLLVPAPHAALRPGSRAQLIRWMKANTTGDERLRAGLPPNWTVGNKTGTGDHGTTNDIALILRPRRAPLLAAVYYTESSLDSAARNTVIERVGRVIAIEFQHD